MNQHLGPRISFLLLVFLAACTPSAVLAQSAITWTGAGDGSTFSDDANWFLVDAGGSGAFGPELQFQGDSLKFDSAGAVLNNDLDPANNNDEPLLLGLGFIDDGSGGNDASNANSAAFHFLAGSGNFTIGGFGAQLGSTSGVTAVRAEAGAGTVQTFNLPLSLGGDDGTDAFTIALNNTVIDPEGTLPITYGEVVFNGDIDFNNDRFFLDETAARVTLNGNNVGGGVRTIGGLSETDLTTNFGRGVLVVRPGGFGSEIVLGSDTSLGAPTTGSWADGTLDLRGLQTLSAAFLDTTAPLDLSAYHLQLQSGNGAVLGSINYRSVHDSSIGYVTSARGNRWLRVTNSGELTIEHGVFLTDNDDARIIVLAPSGLTGNDGSLVINGTIHNTIIDPIAATGMIPDPENEGSFITVNGGIDNSSRGGIASDGQLVALDGTTPINGTVQARFGNIALNADSSSTFIGSQFRILLGATVSVGSNGAFGDAGSLVAVEADSTLDTGVHTIEQRFVSTDGTIRGNGVLTNEGDWSITGVVAPGGETPTASDALTFDFSGAAVGNTLQFETGSTIDLALDAGLASSTVDVLGPAFGGVTDIVLDDNTFNFTDLSAGSLTEGAYVLIDGDANTSFTLGSVATTGLTGFSGSTISVVGDDLVLNLVAGADPLLGDYNDDGIVDAADYTVWRDNLGLSNAALNGNGLNDASGLVVPAEYLLWFEKFGDAAASSAAAAVPEPTMLSMLACALAVSGLFGRGTLMSTRRITHG